MSTLEMANNQEHFCVRNLMQAFEAELYDLGKLAETAQLALSGVLALAANDPACHREAQVLDLLTQRLYGMSGFLTMLAPNIPGFWQVDTSEAVKTVSLGHLADRLNGRPVAILQHDSGELDMF